MDKIAIKFLNSFLKEEYATIDVYEKNIKTIQDANVLGKLQEIQNEHRHNTLIVSDRIIELGGEPIKGALAINKITNFFSNVKVFGKNNTEGKLEEICKEENDGLCIAKKVVNSQMDNESREIINNVIDNNNNHINSIRDIMSSIKK